MMILARHRNSGTMHIMRRRLGIAVTGDLVVSAFCGNAKNKLPVKNSIEAESDTHTSQFYIHDEKISPLISVTSLGASSRSTSCRYECLRISTPWL